MSDPVRALAEILLDGPPVYDAQELAEAVGIDRVYARRLWRALGFSDVPDGEKAFTDGDRHALEAVRQLLDHGIADEELVVQLSRVFGSAMARVAEAQVSVVQQWLQEGQADTPALVALSKTLLPVWADLLIYSHRRHLHASFSRVLEKEATGPAIAVGFADLVGFTALSQELDERELAALVDRFESLAYDTIGMVGGRIVKMIGDEVMFMADTPAAAVEVGLSLSEAYADDETLDEVRVGLATGPVLAREGDLFGPAVNLASRIVNIAKPGSVVTSADVREELHDDPRYVWRPLRPRRLKGIGIETLWRVRRRPPT